MTEQPWVADRLLTEETVRRVLAEQLPELEVRNLRLLGSGWDNDVYLVNEALVLRFPRRKLVADALAREARVLRRVVRVFEGARLQVPDVELFGRASDAFPYPFLVYRLLPGIAADQAEVLDRAELAKALGDAFARLHRSDIPGVPHGTYDPAEWLERARRVAESCLAAIRDDPLRARCRSWLAAPDIPKPYQGPPRIIHGDICPDHLLVDPPTGKPTGLIDFADLERGDPVADFVSLRCWLGPGFVEEILESYDLAPDAEFWPRLESLARSASLVWLDEALTTGEDLSKHVRWVEISFTP